MKALRTPDSSQGLTRRSFAAALAGAALPALAQTPADGKVLRVGYLNNYAPFSWVERDGKAIRGFNVELVQALCDQMGLRHDIRTQSYAQLLQAMRRGELDLIGNFFTRVPDLVNEFAFSSGLYDFRLMLVQHEEDEQTYLTLDEINLSRLGVLANTTVEDQVLAAQGKGYQRFNSIDQALQALSERRLDAMIEEGLIVEHAIFSRRLPLKTTTPMSAPVKLGMLVLKPQAPWLVGFNRELERLRQSGTAGQISERWFGHDVTQRRAAGTYINPNEPS